MNRFTIHAPHQVDQLYTLQILLVFLKRSHITLEKLRKNDNVNRDFACIIVHTNFIHFTYFVTKKRRSQRREFEFGGCIVFVAATTYKA